jgi:hypothetical protein
MSFPVVCDIVGTDVLPANGASLVYVGTSAGKVVIPAMRSVGGASVSGVSFAGAEFHSNTEPSGLVPVVSTKAIKDKRQNSPLASRRLETIIVIFIFLSFCSRSKMKHTFSDQVV